MAISFKRETLIRTLPARCALIFIVAHAGSALARAVVPDTARQEAGAARLVLASLGERWVLATSTPRRGVRQEKGAVPGASASPAPAPALPKSSYGPAAARTAGPVVTATATGPGQSGYVHYFVIEAPDGEREIQIGIELADGRIAWSFPGLGVVVSPFIESGELPADGRTYAVRHLYGIRPFPDDESMLALQNELLRRVIPWIDDATPYCALGAPSSQPCLSCLGFVLRVLYPSRPGGVPSLPPDFERSSPGMYFTTEDLLLYQTGLHGSRSREERLGRIRALTVPQNLRDDLIELAHSIAPEDGIVTEASAAPKKTAAKKRPASRSNFKTGQQRPSTRKKL